MMLRGSWDLVSAIAGLETLLIDGATYIKPVKEMISGFISPASSSYSDPGPST